MASALLDAQDQIDSVLLASSYLLSKGVISADEVWPGKTIEAELLIARAGLITN